MQYGVALTLILLLFLFQWLALAELSGEARLLETIFKEYKKEARPCRNVSKPVQVSVGFTLTRLDALTWKDDFLSWHPSHYDNLKRVTISGKSIWQPDIALDNSVGDIYNGDFADRFRVSIHHSGEVLWEPGGTFQTTCEMTINAYPFDHQTCYIVFASWQYTHDQVNLTTRQDKISMGTYAESGEWEIEYTNMTRAVWSSHNYPNDLYPEIMVTIHVRRRFLYYLVNVMLPCMMMSSLVLVVFHLPPDSGEKVSLGVTVLLAFSVFQLMIAESVPTSSKSIPLIEIYLLFFMGESTFSVAVSVLVLNFHHRMEYKPPPDWLRKLVLDWMAGFLFMRRIKINATYPMNALKRNKVSDAHIKTEKRETNVIEKTVINYESETGNIKEDGKDSKQPLTSNGKPSISSQLPLKNEPVDTSCVTDLTQSEQNSTRIPEIQIHLSESKSQSVHSMHNNTPIEHSKTKNMNHLKSCGSTRFEPGDHSSTRGLSPEVARSAVRLIRSLAAIDKMPSGTYRDELMTMIQETYREISQRRKDDEMDAVFENEWKRIAKIVDRFFFITTSVMMIISTIVVFCVMPYSNHD